MEGIYGYFILYSVRYFLLLFIKDLLSVICDKSLTIDPKPITLDSQNSMTHLSFC